jgi:hypothetical protein
VFAGHHRDQLRAVFFRAWAKHRRGEPLEGVEPVIARIVSQHPEYHALLADEDAAGRDYHPESGETNPFLHLSMHVAIEEGLLIDEPRGVREHYRRLLTRVGDEHEAQHRMMECLGEMLWRAQRDGRAPDTAGYLDCLSRLAVA